MIDHVAANLDLHEMIVMKAKEMFAEFRDLRGTYCELNSA